MLSRIPLSDNGTLVHRNSECIQVQKSRFECSENGSNRTSIPGLGFRIEAPNPCRISASQLPHPSQGLEILRMEYLRSRRGRIPPPSFPNQYSHRHGLVFPTKTRVDCNGHSWPVSTRIDSPLCYEPLNGSGQRVRPKAAPSSVSQGGCGASRSPLHEGAAAFERVAAAAGRCLGRRGSVQTACRLRRGWSTLRCRGKVCDCLIAVIAYVR